jgi:DNA polymerase I-like protein with 3'-5' exonuclease and polymerase domains
MPAAIYPPEGGDGVITIQHTLAGDDCVIYTPERRADLAGFADFLALGDAVLGLDTETSGLDIYSPGYELRLVQVGNDREAWNLDPRLFAFDITKLLRSGRRFALHNAAFDLQVIDRHLGVTIEELSDRCFDTRIFAHLIDPRDEAAGGAGLSLKPLSAIYVDPEAPDTQKGLHARFRELGFTSETGWAHIDLHDPLYLRYAGLDVLLESRLFKALSTIIRDIGLSHLATFEALFQAYCCIMQRKGMLLDLDYMDPLSVDLSAEAAHFRTIARQWGVENVNSTAQVAEALLAMGVELEEKTKSGAWKVDKEVLLPLADLNNLWERRDATEPNPLADATIRAKRASKWQTSYVDAFRRLADDGDRLHASIGALQARTARMSVSRPPLQQLPSSDWKVRRAIIADPGHLLMSADYDQIELRVLAALADVKAMKAAIAAGEDLHGYTAKLVYGDDYTSKQRKLMKGVGFGKVYGGGAKTLSRQTGAPIDDVKRAVADYDRVYPEVKRYGRMLQRKAEFGKREVITVSGRHLPLDRDRLYSATNYVVQSTARDILAQAIVDLFDAGLGDYLLLPIHDEVLAQAPDADAEDVAREIGRVMSQDFRGVPLTATADITGSNWGAAYGADPEAGRR